MHAPLLVAALLLATLASSLVAGPASAAATTRLSVFNDINTDSVTRGIVSSSPPTISWPP
ncbi:MAG: hypothetical protein WDA16_00815 [Candidatus Thermoplasmatota archaeon]